LTPHQTLIYTKKASTRAASARKNIIPQRARRGLNFPRPAAAAAQTIKNMMKENRSARAKDPRERKVRSRAISTPRSPTAPPPRSAVRGWKPPDAANVSPARSARAKKSPRVSKNKNAGKEARGTRNAK